MSQKIVQVIPATKIPPEKNQVFSYSISKKVKQSIKIGQEVLVPFGHRKVRGIIQNIESGCKNQKIQLKNILKIVDGNPTLNKQQLKLARWLADYYHASLGLVIKIMLPERVKQKAKKGLTDRKIIIDDGKRKINFSKLDLKQQKILKALLLKHSSVNWRVCLLSRMTSLERAKIYTVVIKEVLNQGKQVIVLVPEISLTQEAIQRFILQFGSKNLAVLHSRQSKGERYVAWQRIRNGKTKIVLGPRSAIFAPVSNLGLIIIDEENDPSYKQSDQNPRYHVKKVALKLAEIFDAKVILGDFNPSIESYFYAKIGRYLLFELPKKSGKDLPRIEVIDMRKEFKKGNWSIFSETLVDLLQQNLASGKTSLLFINRRGASTFIICRDCGYVIRCPKCEVPLVFHINSKSKASFYQTQSNISDSKLICHYCFYKQIPPILCPKCKSHYLKYFGIGTQKVELEIKKLFPQARVIRIDSDVVNKKFVHSNLYLNFKNFKADILIGTQMIEGLSLPEVNLVSIISADTAMHLPDFRSAERTYQMIVRVASHARCGKFGGKMILQTYNPENFVIKTAAKNDFHAFYEYEIKKRKELNYPPFSQLIKLTSQNSDLNKIKRSAKDLVHKLSAKASDLQLPIVILGPASAFVSKIRERYKWQILIKYKFIKNEVEPKREKVKKLLNLVPANWTIDVEPENLL